MTDPHLLQVDDPAALDFLLAAIVAEFTPGYATIERRISRNRTLFYLHYHESKETPTGLRTRTKQARCFADGFLLGFAAHEEMLNSAIMSSFKRDK